MPLVPKRSFTLRFVRWGVLALAIWNLGRAIALWHQADWLAGLPLTPDPRLRMTFALGWAASFFAAFISAIRCKPWSRFFIPFLLTLYGVYEFGMVMIFSPTPPAPLSALIYITFILLSVWTLWRRDTFSTTTGNQGSC